MTDLPAWASTLIMAAVSCVITTIIGFCIKYSIQKKIDERSRLTAENEELKHKQRKAERKAEMKEIVDEALKPIDERLDDVEEKLNSVDNTLYLDKKATITQIRVTMMGLHDRYMKEGYVGEHEKQTWLELYQNYKALGGNHFREYVDGLKKDVEELPSEKPVKRTTKKK